MLSGSWHRDSASWSTGGGSNIVSGWGAITFDFDFVILLDIVESVVESSVSVGNSASFVSINFDLMEFAIFSTCAVVDENDTSLLGSLWCVRSDKTVIWVL